MRPDCKASLLVFALFTSTVFSSTMAQTAALPSGIQSSSAAQAPATEPAGPAYLSDPKFQKAYDAAKEKRQPFDEHLARWKKASKLADGQCIECLREMIRLQVRLQAWKDALNTTAQLQAIATAPEDKFYAAQQRGELLMLTNNGKPKPEALKEADTTLKMALTVHPNNRNALYTEGRVLAMLGQNDEAKAVFQRYLDHAGEADHFRVRVEHFIDDPHLATQPMAPPFTIVTAQGEEMNLDDMNGKVVLLDFWATWCGPCKETTPEIARIAKNFAGQPLVVISISSDRDDIAWKTYIEKNHMDWPQYRDANGALSAAYAVSAIPRFFTIDTDGVLQSIKVGSDADVAGDIRRLVSKANKALKQKVQNNDHTPVVAPTVEPAPSADTTLVAGQVAQNRSSQ
jgi:thiol-disulfide isomerase/thioredoxin